MIGDHQALDHQALDHREGARRRLREERIGDELNDTGELGATTLSAGEVSLRRGAVGVCSAGVRRLPRRDQHDRCEPKDCDCKGRRQRIEAQHHRLHAEPRGHRDERDAEAEPGTLKLHEGHGLFPFFSKTGGGDSRSTSSGGPSLSTRTFVAFRALS